MVLKRVGSIPLPAFQRDVHKGCEVAKTERGPVAPRARLILKRPREGRREVESPLADILLDRGLDVAASQRVRSLLPHDRCGVVDCCIQSANH